MSTTTTRPQIVNAARAWLDTPFHHQARLRGVGVDCIGLVIGVSRELGLIAPDFDITAYPRTPDGTSLMATAREHMTEIDRDVMQPGDVVVVSFDKEPQHFGILGDYRHGGLSIIHASSQACTAKYAPVGRVIETRLMFSQQMKFVAAFVLPGVV
jgi:cell wall-associated NlpC family hydrolase